jgi:hypothetical protein
LLAEITFVHLFLLGMAVSRPVGTGRDTATTAYTQLFIDFYCAVFCVLVGGAGGASLHTGRVVAVHAITGLKMHGSGFVQEAGMFKIRLLLLDPIAPVSRSYLVFNLAGCHAAFAVYAQGGIYHHR